MRRIPDDLDPRTLRWLADDACSRAAFHADLAQHHREAAGDAVNVVLFDHHKAVAVEIDDYVETLRREAKRLRSLATRIERRRAGGTK